MIVLTSAKGSPGATTLGLALACASGGVLVEMDPAGGDVALRAGLCQVPGLIELSVRARRERGDAVALERCVQRLGSGANVVPAPVTAAALSSVLGNEVALAETVAALRRPPGRTRVVVDAGRFGPHAAALLDAPGSLCAVVARCDTACLGHTREVLAEVAARGDVGLVLIECGEFPPAHVAAEFGARLLGVIPWHPRHAARLTGSAVAQTPRTNRLVRAAAAVSGAAGALADVGGRLATAGNGVHRAPHGWREVSA